MPTPAQAALLALASGVSVDAVETRRLLDLGRNVILYGPPGTGKTYAAMAVCQQWLAEHGAGSVVLTTFHPAYSYEDFVEGYRPDPTHPDRFVLLPGTLLRAAEAALRRPVLLVIDEINRADVGRVFGELITFIERDKRGIRFFTAQNRTKEHSIPDNLYVLGTMNTADKSVSLLDVALRRRFAFVQCPPDPNSYSTVTTWAADVAGIPLSAILTAVNRRLLEEGVERDRLVGHAILSVPTGAGLSELTDRIRYDLVPLVDEYLFADSERIAAVLPGALDASGKTKATLTVEDLRLLAGVLPAAAGAFTPEDPADTDPLTLPGQPDDAPHGGPDAPTTDETREEPGVDDLAADGDA